MEKSKIDSKKKEVVSLLMELINLLEKYKDLNIGEINQTIRLFLKTSEKNQSKTPQIVLPSDIIEKIYNMSRNDLIDFLNNSEQFPKKLYLVELAKKLHIKNASRMSIDSIKQKIISVVYDRPNELKNMGKEESKI